MAIRMWRDDDGSDRAAWELTSVHRQMQRLIEVASKSVADDLAATVHQVWSGFLPSSPLEAIFIAAWETQRLISWNEPFDFSLEPQVEVIAAERRYRLDFKVYPRQQRALYAAAERVGRPFPKLAVELDGHEFHERSKEQVIDRDQRDRDLQVGGFVVFHFSGTALHRDPLACASEVWNHARHESMQRWLELDVTL